VVAGVRTIHRGELIPALEKYSVDYRKRLLADKDRQDAFIVKFDHLSKP
jgi:hypothetical protein